MRVTDAKRLLESYTFNKQIFEELLYNLKEHQLKRNELSFEKVGGKNIEILKFLHDKKEHELKIKVDNVQNLINNTETTIENLNQPSRNLLYYRYLKEYSYEKISRKMSYSLQRIYQLHNKAVKEFSYTYDLITQTPTFGIR